MSAPAVDLAFGLLLGFSLVVPPGPMNAWIAATSARSYRAGVLTGLGAMSADAVLGAAVFLLDRSVPLASVVRGVYAVGAIVMTLLAVRLLRPRAQPPRPPSGPTTVLRAVGIGLSNPFQLLWWLTAGVAFAYLGGAILLAGLFGAILIWVVLFPWAVHAGATRWPAAARWIDFASGLILAGFAAYFGLLAVAG